MVWQHGSTAGLGADKLIYRPAKVGPSRLRFLQKTITQPAAIAIRSALRRRSNVRSWRIPDPELSS